MRYESFNLISPNPLLYYCLVYCFTLVLLLQKVRHIKQLPVNLKALMDGLSSLLLPSQKAMFSQHMYEFSTID